MGSFRTRLLVTFLLVTLIPIVAMAFFVRSQTTNRLSAQYEQRVESLVSVIGDDLRRQSESIRTTLAALGSAAADDNRLRRAAVNSAADERPYLLDFAGRAMNLGGLAMLQIQDADGRILSSGHFRNEFDRVEEDLPRLVVSVGSPSGSTSTPEGTAVVVARSPTEPFLALVRVDSFRMGGRTFTLVGGTRVGSSFLDGLTRDSDVIVELEYPHGVLVSSRAGDGTVATVDSRGNAEAPDGRPATEVGSIVRELQVPFVRFDQGDPRSGKVETASFRVSHGRTELVALRRSIDQWFLIAVGIAAVFAVLAAAWIASRISRPIVELADKTSRINLDRLNVDFRTRRKDEIGTLSRVLGAMTERLRASGVAIKDAERRAAQGELARQVNHDIKNGLTPVRNVFQHLGQLAEGNSEEMVRVFEERRGTLESSISYLENLATQYARLAPRADRQACDVNETIRVLAKDVRASRGADVRTILADRAVVAGDPLSLRRILENLVDNALDAMTAARSGNDAGTGTRRGPDVTIETSLVSAADGTERVRVAISDTGTGMSEEESSKVFEDFYTTKSSGTGLGLSIVRRLVMDLDGSIRVESEKGVGSSFSVDFPAVRRTE